MQSPASDCKDRFWWLRSNAVVKLLAVVLVMGACMAVAALINHRADVSRRDSGRRTLQATARDVIRATNRSVELVEGGFEIFSEINRVSPMRTADQFARISSALVDMSPFVVGTLLITELPGDERDSLEAAWREEYPELPEHSIHNGTEQVAPEQDEYLVARFLHPTTSIAFTLDWNSEGVPPEHNRTYREALRRTLPGQDDAGGIVVSDLFPVVPRPDSPLGYMIAVGVDPPFQDCDCPEGTTGDGPSPYPGVATIGFLTESFVTRLFDADDEEVPDLIIWVTDVTHPTQERRLFEPRVPVPDRDRLSIYLGDHDPTIREHLHFFDKTWSIQIEPGEELLESLFGTTSTFWIGGAILALTLGSLCLCLIYLRELSQANAVVETARAATIQTHQELVSFLCHEIRNPLHVVQALVGDKHGVDREALRLVRISIRQIQYLVDDVLSARRLTESTMEVYPESTDVLVVLRNVVHKHRKAVQPGVELRFEVQQSMPRFAMVDPVRLKQVIEIALTNAVRLTSSGFIAVRVALVATSEGAWEDDVSDCRAPVALLGECISPESGTKADETVYEIRVQPAGAEDADVPEDEGIGATAVALEEEEEEEEEEEKSGKEVNGSSGPTTAASPRPASSIGDPRGMFGSPARPGSQNVDVEQGAYEPPHDAGSVSPSSSMQSHAPPERRARDLIGTLVVEVRNTGPAVGLSPEEVFAPSTEVLHARGHNIGPLVEKMRRSFRKPPASLCNAIDRGVFQRSAENGVFMVARDTPFPTQSSTRPMSPSGAAPEGGVTQRTQSSAISSASPPLAGLRPRYGNNGLGLPISSSIVQLMRGYIGLDDTLDAVPEECSPGDGVSRFWITIPVALEPAREATMGGDERFLGTETTSSRTGSGTTSREQGSSQTTSDPSRKQASGTSSLQQRDFTSQSTQMVATTYSEASAGDQGGALTPRMAARQGGGHDMRSPERAPGVSTRSSTTIDLAGSDLLESSIPPRAVRWQVIAPQAAELGPGVASESVNERQGQWNESLCRPSPVVTSSAGAQSTSIQSAADRRASFSSPAGARRVVGGDGDAWAGVRDQTRHGASERVVPTYGGREPQENVAGGGDEIPPAAEGPQDSAPDADTRRTKRRRRKKRRHKGDDWKEGRGTVVVVDDDRSNLVVTSRMLQRVGFRCVQVEDGIYLKETLARMRQEGDDPIAVLLDIVMVHSRGTDVCRQLREEGEAVPIAAMTGNIGEWDIREYRRAGFNSTIGKPFSATDVTSFVNAVHGLDRSNQSATSPSGVPWVAGNVRES